MIGKHQQKTRIDASFAQEECLCGLDLKTGITIGHAVTVIVGLASLNGGRAGLLVIAQTICAAIGIYGIQSAKRSHLQISKLSVIFSGIVWCFVAVIFAITLIGIPFAVAFFGIALIDLALFHAIERAICIMDGVKNEIDVAHVEQPAPSAPASAAMHEQIVIQPMYVQHSSNICAPDAGTLTS
eukprot:527378_1